MEWISVKDKLPEKDFEEVLITNGKYVQQSCFSKWDNGPSFGKSEWFGDVTYWMEMPKSPVQ